jgi:hypothetical protein
MQVRFNTPRLALTLAAQAHFSRPFDAHRHDILKSQFHLLGHRHFPKSKLLSRIMDSSIVDIERTQVALEKKRAVVVEMAGRESSEGPAGEHLQQYF